jgi:2-hydroxy-3-oxopropionate reductase
MGRPMALNLVNAGFRVTVSARRPQATQLLRQAGASVASNPRELAGANDIVITMVPDSADVVAIVEGDDGLLDGMRHGALVIDMSTISPVVTRHLAARVAEHGGALIDAPVSGGDQGAREGKLSIMVGGDRDDLKRARPVLEFLGQRITWCGPSGAGQVAKACNQIVVAAGIQALAEAATLARKSGLDPAHVLDAIGGGLGASRVLEMRGPNLLSRELTPGFRASLHLKDLDLALEQAREAGAVMPVAAMMVQLLQAQREAGWGDLDHSALLLVTEMLSGLAGEYSKAGNR